MNGPTHRDLYPSLRVFDGPPDTPERAIERAAFRTAAIAVVELLHTTTGHGEGQRGQRRGMRRVLAKINAELTARGGEQIDDGQSWSEDTIDEGLRA